MCFITFAHQTGSPLDIPLRAVDLLQAGGHFLALGPLQAVDDLHRYSKYITKD